MRTITYCDTRSAPRVPDAAALREVGLTPPAPATPRHAYVVTLHGEEVSRHLHIEAALLRAAQRSDEHGKGCACSGPAIHFHSTDEPPRVIATGCRRVTP